MEGLRAEASGKAVPSEKKKRASCSLHRRCPRASSPLPVPSCPPAFLTYFSREMALGEKQNGVKKRTAKDSFSLCACWSALLDQSWSPAEVKVAMCTRCPLHAAGTPHALGALSRSSKSAEPGCHVPAVLFLCTVTQAHQSPTRDDVTHAHQSPAKEGQLVLRRTAEHTGHTTTPPCRLQRVRGQNLPIP